MAQWRIAGPAFGDAKYGARATYLSSRFPLWQRRFRLAFVRSNKHLLGEGLEELALSLEFPASLVRGLKDVLGKWGQGHTSRLTGGVPTHLRGSSAGSTRPVALRLTMSRRCGRR